MNCALRETSIFPYHAFDCVFCPIIVGISAIRATYLSPSQICQAFGKHAFFFQTLLVLPKLSTFLRLTDSEVNSGVKAEPRLLTAGIEVNLWILLFR